MDARRLGWLGTRTPRFARADAFLEEPDFAMFALPGADHDIWSSSIPDFGWFHFRGPDGNVYGMMQGSRAVGD